MTESTMADQGEQLLSAHGMMRVFDSYTFAIYKRDKSLAVITVNYADKRVLLSFVGDDELLDEMVVIDRHGVHCTRVPLTPFSQ